MAELDHLIFACADLDAGVAHIEALTGVRAEFGGPHIGSGTRNSLLTLDERTYFEIIAIDPDQPDTGRPRPFGIDESTIPRLAGYAVHPTGGETLESVASSMRTAGFDPGPIVDWGRTKPDGELLSWRLTVGAGGGLNGNGALPFAIDWGETPSPATSLRPMGRLVSLAVAHPDAAIRASADALDLGIAVSEGPVRLVATVDSPNGVVEIA